MMKSTLVLSFIIGVSMLGQTAFAVELRRDHLIIDFPVPPSSGEVVERHEVGSIRRYGAVAQTDTCDYALFEFQYPRRYIQAIGEEGLLAEAVRESVLNHEGQVQRSLSEVVAVVLPWSTLVLLAGPSKATVTRGTFRWTIRPTRLSYCVSPGSAPTHSSCVPF